MLFFLPPWRPQTPSFPSHENFWTPSPPHPWWVLSVGLSYALERHLLVPSGPRGCQGETSAPWWFSLWGARPLPSTVVSVISLSLLRGLCLGLYISGVGLCCVLVWISLGLSCLTHVQTPHSAGFYVFCQIWGVFRDYCLSCFFSLVLLPGLWRCGCHHIVPLFSEALNFFQSFLTSVHSGKFPLFCLKVQWFLPLFLPSRELIHWVFHFGYCIF